MKEGGSRINHDRLSRCRRPIARFEEVQNTTLSPEKRDAVDVRKNSSRLLAGGSKRISTGTGTFEGQLVQETVVMETGWVCA